MDATTFNTLLQHGDKKRIAQAAGVGISTVSRVLSGDKVQVEYVAKVLQAATTLLKTRRQQLQRVEKSAGRITNSLL